MMVLHMIAHEQYLMRWVRGHGSSYEEMVLPFHNAFLLHIQKLPMRKREMLELVYHYMVFEKPEYVYDLNQEYKHVKYPRTSLMKHHIEQLSSYLYLYHKDTQIPDWIEPRNTNDVRKFLIEAIDLYDDTAWEVFNGL